jgi:hypothetical protein
MSQSGGIPGKSSGRHQKLIDHWHLRSLTSIQLIHLHMIGNSLSGHHRLCDELDFPPIRGSQLDELLGAVDQCLVFTQLGHTNNDVNALRFLDYKVGDKVYPPYFQTLLQA